VGRRHTYPVDNRVSFTLGLWYRFFACVHWRNLGIGLQAVNGTLCDAVPANGFDARGFDADGLDGVKHYNGVDGNDLQELRG